MEIITRLRKEAALWDCIPDAQARADSMLVRDLLLEAAMVIEELTTRDAGNG